MGKVKAFNFISLDGFFEGEKGDISWHQHGEEENEYVADMLITDDILMFGRVTYEMMIGYWTTPVAIQNDPVVAERMNKADKIVFSRTMEKATWNNTKLLKGDIFEEIKKLKQSAGKDMTLLGSGSIFNQFTENGLIDEYQIMVDPVVLGSGTPLFKDLNHMLKLKLISTRAFKSGKVLLCYQTL